MDLKTECALSFFEEVHRINDKVSVVRSVTDDKMYVKKVHKQYDRKLYQVLQENPHPGLATVYDVYETDGSLTTIEQFINGVTLESHLMQQGRLSEGEAVRIAVQVAHALQFLHSRTPPIIHRDIKLSNIMLDEHGDVKIVDFDTSRQFQEAGDKDTQVLGTVGYAAPEQYGFMQSDVRSDLYSLGVLLSKLLNGLEEGGFHYSGRLEPVIARCTRFSPEDRYPDIESFLAQLTQAPGAEQQIAKKSMAPPGFRTGKLWKMIVAVIGYLLLAFFSMAFATTTELSVVRGIEKGSLFLLGISLIALYTNYRNLHTHLPLLDKRGIPLKALGILLWTAAFCFLFVVILLMVHILFGQFP